MTSGSHVSISEACPNRTASIGALIEVSPSGRQDLTTAVSCQALADPAGEPRLVHERRVGPRRGAKPEPLRRSVRAPLLQRRGAWHFSHAQRVRHWRMPRRPRPAHARNDPRGGAARATTCRGSLPPRVVRPAPFTRILGAWDQRTMSYTSFESRCATARSPRERASARPCRWPARHLIRLLEKLDVLERPPSAAMRLAWFPPGESTTPSSETKAV